MDDIIIELFTFPVGKNDKQIEKLLKILTKSQKLKIQKFVKDVLHGKKHLTDIQYRNLSKYKDFLRKLSIGNFSVNSIIHNYDGFFQIVKILLEYKNGSSVKSYFSTV